MENNMKTIKIEKVTLNIGAGKDQALLKKGVMLLKELTGIEPIQTISKCRIPTWGLRLGLPIGCKITLRKSEADIILKRMLKAKENILKPTQFDQSGNLSFGVAEYIDIPNANYNPDIGIIGLEIAITLKRPGYRIKNRRIKTKKIGKKHIITKQESMDFMQKEYGIKIGE